MKYPSNKPLSMHRLKNRCGKLYIFLYMCVYRANKRAIPWILAKKLATKWKRDKERANNVHERTRRDENKMRIESILNRWQNENERKLQRWEKNKNPIQTNSSAQLIGISHSSTAKDDTAILFSLAFLSNCHRKKNPPTKNQLEK